MRLASLIHQGTKIKISFPPAMEIFSELIKIQNLEETPGGFLIPIKIENVFILQKLKFIFSKALQKWYDNENTKIETLKPAENLQLMPFQQKGVEFLERKQGRALIADEMGLGKTVQALSYLKNHPEMSPALIICPAFLKINWKREIERWLGCDCQIINGTKEYPITNKIVIINYDIIGDWVEKLKEENFSILISDEAHLIKNNKAKRTKAFKRIAKGISKIVALTGTPIENKPVEIYNIVNILDPFLFPNYMFFAQRYCNAKKNNFGWDFTGHSNTIELNKILRNSVMIRRKKSEVLTELPPKNIVKIAVEIENRNKYELAEKAFITYLKEKFKGNFGDEIKTELKEFAKRNKIAISDELTDYEIENLKQEKFKKVSAAPIFAQIESLKQIAVEGKINKIIDWINEFLQSDEKLVIFAVHRKVITKLMNEFGEIAVKVDGSVSQIERQKAVDKFQTDINTRLFIGNIKSSGLGITLTAASNAAIIQFPWSPGELSQAADRIHRITQTKQVTIWNIVGVDTIEEKIIDILKRKEKIIAGVIDGELNQDSTIFNELIKSYLK